MAVCEGFERRFEIGEGFIAIDPAALDQRDNAAPSTLGRQQTIGRELTG